MRWNFIFGAASLPFPKQSVEIVCFTENYALPDVESLGEGFEIKDPSCQLQV